MNKDHVKAAYQDTKGKIKEGVGAAMNKPGLETEGQIDQAGASVRKGYADIKDAVK